MKKLATSILFASFLVLLLGLVAWAAPTLNVANSQVTIRSDGSLNVKYRLTFLEN